MSSIDFLGVSIFAWITIILMAGKVILLLRSKMPSDLMAMGIIALLLITGTLSSEEALSSFGSQSVVLLAVLFILAAGLVHAGVTHWISNYILGTPKTFNKMLLRLMIPVAAMSAFMNNNVVVLLFLNVVKVWAKRFHVAPSKLLIPLTYASGMGGVCTIIGVPSNLIVNDFYYQKTGEQLGLFTPFIPGVFCLIVGITAVILLQKLLPERKDPEDSFESSADYTVELMVPTQCDAVGQTVEESGLTNVKGGHLIEIIRFDREIISPVPKDEFIMGGDHLVYSGQINSILELRKTHGLVNATHHVFKLSDVNRTRKLQMANVHIHSMLVGKCMEEIDFENKNNVVLIAVAREGKRLTGIPREIKLQPGDTLLLEGEKLRPEDFVGHLRFFDSIVLPQEGKKTILSALIMLGMIVLSITNVMSLLNSCLLAAILMVATKCCSYGQVQRSINWKLILVFAGSVCLGKALTATGLTDLLAAGIISISGTDPLTALIAICICGTLANEFMASTTVAAILAPIGLQIATNLEVNPTTFCIAILICASSCFNTPLGAESHLIVYGPGGYKFTDFLKIGFPMSIIMLVANLLIVNLLFPL